MCLTVKCLLYTTSDADTQRENASLISMCLTMKCLLYTANDADTQRKYITKSMCLTVKCILYTANDADTQREKCIINFHVFSNEMAFVHH